MPDSFRVAPIARVVLKARVALTRITLAAILIALPSLCPAEDIFVSPNGDDSNPGTQAKPLANLATAVKQARGQRDQPTTIRLGSGTFYLDKPIVFTKEDARPASARLTITADKDATPIISGGQKLELEWEHNRHGVHFATTPDGLTFDQLFIDGQRQHMARWPNYDPTAQYFQGYSAKADSPERYGKWSNPKGGFVHAMHRSLWGDMHWRIDGKKESGELMLTGGWQNNRQMGAHKEYRFVENIFEELDTAHEWYHDASKNKLYFYPDPKSKFPDAKVEVVRLKHLIEFRGDEKQPVTNIRLKDLTFTHTARTFMENKEPLLRSDWTTYRGGAILFQGATDCRIDDCFLDQVGGNGIFVDRFNRRIHVHGCHIAGAGASAISFVGNPKALRSPLFEYHQKNTLEDIDKTPGPQSNDYPADCTVEECLIYLNGRVEKQTAGVNICMAESITVRHCSVYDCPRAGINICDGAFGGHLIEFCDVFDTVKETGDHGSFNSWGRDRFWHPDRKQTSEWLKSHPEMPKWDCHKPIIIRNNRFRCDHGWDIDLDDGSSNYELYNNLCLAGGIKLREGFFRNVYNNIMVDYTFCPHVWYPDCHTSFQRNIIFQPTYAQAGMKKTDQTESVDYNLVHQPDAKESSAAELAKWGADQNSLVADAQFIDPINGDYRVKADSPAIKLGFKNFAMDQFGVQTKLKSLARTPPLPGTLAASQIKSGGWGRKYSQPKTAIWKGWKIKEIQTDGEMSSVGLGDKDGVLVVEKHGDSKLPLQPNDVIRAVNGKPVKGLSDLASLWKMSDNAQTIKLTIWRDQSSTEVELPHSE